MKLLLRFAILSAFFVGIGGTAVAQTITLNGTAVQVYEDSMYGGCWLMCNSALPSGDMVIPFSVNGIPVTSVDHLGCVPCYDYSGTPPLLTSLTIPESVRRIGTQCFGRQTSLRMVELPTSLESIGPAAFEDCGGIFLFKGVKPRVEDYPGVESYADASPFKRTFISAEPSVNAVYFRRGASGWTNGGSWRGVLTYAWDPLPTALDVANLTFTDGGNSMWFGQASVSHDGWSAAQSGKVGANQSSSMQTTVTGPANISFWWKVSSESVNYDYLEFLIDGMQKDKIGGTDGSWAQKTYSIGSGSHTLKWNYRKDGSVDGGDDCGWVDQLVVTSKSTTWPTSYRTSFNSDDLWCTEEGSNYYQPVVMDPGGASGVQRLYERLSRAYYPAPPCPYSRAGYEFAGWEFYSRCYDGLKFFSCQGFRCGGLVGIRQPGEMLDICDLSALVATWTPVSSRYRVSFNANGGGFCSDVGAKSVAYGERLGTLPEACRDGYRFEGWYTSASGGSRVTESTTMSVRYDITLVARWTPVSLW